LISLRNGQPQELAVARASGADAANSAVALITETFRLAQFARDLGIDKDMLQAAALEIAA